MPRDLFLARFRPVLDAFSGDQVNAVARIAHDSTAHVVGNDPVGILVGALGDGILDHPLGLGRKTDEQLRALLAILVLLVALRLGFDLFVRPPSLYSLVGAES